MPNSAFYADSRVANSEKEFNSLQIFRLMDVQSNPLQIQEEKILPQRPAFLKKTKRINSRKALILSTVAFIYLILIGVLIYVAIESVILNVQVDSSLQNLESRALINPLNDNNDYVEQSTSSGSLSSSLEAGNVPVNIVGVLQQTKAVYGGVNNQLASVNNYLASAEYGIADYDPNKY
jgi:hypothetical protein